MPSRGHASSYPRHWVACSPSWVARSPVTTSTPLFGWPSVWRCQTRPVDARESEMWPPPCARLSSLVTDSTREQWYWASSTRRHSSVTTTLPSVSVVSVGAGDEVRRLGQVARGTSSSLPLAEGRRLLAFSRTILGGQHVYCVLNLDRADVVRRVTGTVWPRS